VSDVRHALVLAAGLGTRLQPLTFVRAKPALPVAGIPLIRRILDQLSSGGVDEAVINLHHLPATITRVVGDGRDLGLRVRYSWEQPRVLGNAGGPRLAMTLLGTPTFLVVNGDTLSDVDLAGLAAAHHATGALVTLALTPNRDFLHYGGVRLDGTSRVTGFARAGQDASGSFHFVGIQVVEAAAFASLAVGEVASSVGGLYDRLLAERPGSIAGFVSDDAFFDIGTVADYVATSQRLAGCPEELVGNPTNVDPTSQVVRSILWDNVSIGAGARLEDCIVTDGVHVPTDSDYRQAILMTGSDGVVSLPISFEPSRAVRAGS
jgi:NDP-sugar pyrophosphorylase family protein